ncbi:hypothetical protein LGR54_18930 [Ancylobacter sp. Lp-2]|uniref:hypothetical protein n=1 Tax=Ancylobacter sp. Lp-2 TaxID=2881339 RepID=UPI001E5F70D1|nr:hypothetical protein [Ancylobacter sp. Lp-2]MCB4770688.1 hypothetical protein [Ancylobacter sp. Lp-2]
MNPALALLPILAGLIILFIGATVLVQRPASQPLLVGACLLVDVVLLGAGLVLLPFALPLSVF